MKKIDKLPNQDDKSEENRKIFKSFPKTGVTPKKSPKPLRRTPIKSRKITEISSENIITNYSDSLETEYSHLSKANKNKPIANSGYSKIFKKSIGAEPIQTTDTAKYTIDHIEDEEIGQSSSLINKDYESLLPKILRFCLYQERSGFETMEKLRSLDCPESLQSKIIEFLITEKYISDIRFAYEYVHGKFTLKKWGRNKILHNIAKHRLPDSLIVQAIAEAIPNDKYLHTLEILANKKWLELGNKKNITTKASLQRYLTQKGFEFDLIIETLKKIGFE